MDFLTEIKNLQVNCYIKTDQFHVSELLKRSKLLIAKDTFISDKIRILQFEDSIYFQEMSNRSEFLIRKMNDLNTANELLRKRMEIYEKMWDGCGCKVDYYS